MDKDDPTGDIRNGTTISESNTLKSCNDFTDTPTTIQQRGNKSGGLDSRFIGLVSAENRTAYALDHGLRLENDRVLALIELRMGTTFPSKFDIRIRARYENFLEGYVQVCDLVPISKHQNVSFVRPPTELEPAESFVEGSN